MKKGYEIELYGRIQGVGFRYFTKRLANKLNLKGFVKNMPDGSVLINVFGDENNLDQFLSKVKEGPVSANVENYNKQKIPDDNLYKHFRIKY